ncbi:MAG: FG-GAP repeat domain-containing protein [Gemmataceae bacterium]
MNVASSPFRWRWFVATALLAPVGVGVFVGCGTNSAPPPPPLTQSALASEDVSEQVHGFCGTACHGYPRPESFPRRYWRKEVERGFRFFEVSGKSVKVPSLDSVVRYYESRAPEELAAPVWKEPSHPLGVRFERVGYPGPAVQQKFAVSNVNLVRLPPAGQKSDPKGPLDILACDMQNGLVMLLRPYEPKPEWKVLAHVSHPAHAEVLDLDGDGILDVVVANLGSFPPTDLRCGSVVWLRGRPDGSFTPHTLLDKVGRVADVQAADFRGTGKLDLVVGVFGWQTVGELLFLENQTTDWDKPKFVPRVLDNRHGTIHVPVADLNGDGKPDFVALFAQEHEAVVAFINEGDGKFRPQTLYQASDPSYGSSGIQLVDLTGSGRLDVLYTNGDILDDPFLFKPYHSIQWLENKGDLKFEHHPITPMFGVHRAVAAPITGSGRKDVVACSFLPHDKFTDRARRNAAAIVVLEQVAPGQFERHVLSTVDADHCTCAVGDLFGTGRQDIVVGNFSSVATDHPVTIWKNLGRAP